MTKCLAWFQYCRQFDPHQLPFCSKDQDVNLSLASPIHPYLNLMKFCISPKKSRDVVPFAGHVLFHLQAEPEDQHDDDGFHHLFRLRRESYNGLANDSRLSLNIDKVSQESRKTVRHRTGQFWQAWFFSSHCHGGGKDCDAPPELRLR